MEARDSNFPKDPTSNELLEKTLAALTIDENPRPLNFDIATTTLSVTEETDNTTANSTDEENNNNDDDPVVIDPVKDPWSPVFNPETDAFTEEELINVLRSFEDDLEDDTNTAGVDNSPQVEGSDIFPAGEALP